MEEKLHYVSNPIRENVQIATKLLFFGLLSIFEQNYYTKTKLKLQLVKNQIPQYRHLTKLKDSFNEILGKLTIIVLVLLLLWLHYSLLEEVVVLVEDFES